MARTSRPLAAALAAVLTAGLTALGVVVATVPAAAAKKKPPVKLSGKVSNHGIGKVKHGAVELEADDFYFQKTFLKSTAGSVEVTIENDGDAPHTFTIDAQDIDEELDPGKSVTVTVDVADGQPVEFYCRFHSGSGMKGAFYTASAKGATAKAGTGSTGSSNTSGSNGSSGDGGANPYGY